MTEQTVLRLDIVDSSIECGWAVESTQFADEFVRDRVAVSVEYSQGDEISRMTMSRPNLEDEVVPAEASGKFSLLRFWLTGIAEPTGTTLGEQLVKRRSAGNALLADPAMRASGRLVAVTLSGSGRLGKRTVDGSRFWAESDESGVWGLCYAVKGARPGSNQDRGCLWGMANSYAGAANEVAHKSATLRNGKSDLKPGSVFCCPAYIVHNDRSEIESLQVLLESAYGAWVAGVDPTVE